MTATTYVELKLPPSGVRAWHLDLAHALDRHETLEVGVAWVDAPPPPARDLDRLLAIERRVHRRPRRSANVAPSRLRHLSGRRPDNNRVLRLDLTGSRETTAQDWSLRFDGRAGEDAAAAALLAGRFPLVEVVDPSGRVVASGRPGSEWPGVTALALDDVLAGCVRLVEAAAEGHHLRLPEGGAGTAVGPAVARTPNRQAVRALASVPLRRVVRTLYRTPHWRVGWRFVDGPGVIDSAEDLPSGWQDLPDDGHHFYADPFPIQVAGRTYLFVEDYDHRTAKGVISVVEFDDHGPIGSPACVLSHRVHLSYPFVLEHDGEVWMIPETSAAGTVELYRATDFPHGWVLDSVLLSDIDANDVTPFRHQGHWWLSATVRRGGSCSDALHLWYADDLRGPWTPHRGNPVVLDIASARPAGRVVQRDGRLLRPAQDGTGGYGSALTLTEIVRLDPAAYEQRVVTRLTPGDGWAGRRLHTLNRAGRLEVIDGSARSPRLPLPGRLSRP